MQETDRCCHNLEWPADGARLAGPAVWLRGWIVGKPGHAFVDVRVRHGDNLHWGILGLPRADLAEYFKSPQPWLPAEYIVGVPVSDGPVALVVEARDDFGAWIELCRLTVQIAPDGAPPPQVEGRIEAAPDGTWTERDAHHPFRGHVDPPDFSRPGARGRGELFGWLLDEAGPIARAFATTDGLVYNDLAHSQTDDELAGRVAHPGARQARLRGAVDFPADLDFPACLRVYAARPDGVVVLCFARRVPAPTPTPAAPSGEADYPAPAMAALPVLPSGRPRRLLIVVRSLLPGDGTLRALDLVRHLLADHAWAARGVSLEDGPMRTDFERADVHSLIVDPAPLLTAADETAMRRALDGLRRQIWWGHLDAIALFDPLGAWVTPLAAERGIPVIFDCLADEPLKPDATAIAPVQALFRAAWRQATAVIFGSHAAARAQAAVMTGVPAAVIPHWHTPSLPAAAVTAPVAYLPLRAAAWLHRHHPDVADRWEFRQGPAAVNDLELRWREDDAGNFIPLVHSSDWSMAGVGACLGPLFDRGPLRPLLDAAALGLPVVAPDTPTTRELFATVRAGLVAADNPLALAHRLLELEADRELFAAERAFIADHIRANHAPTPAMRRWGEQLAGVAARRG